MLVLLGIGFVAGVVTALLPCVLPVLPVLLAGGATGRKPLRIVAGLVASFSTFTLFASWLLSHLGLPQDLLRNVAIALLFVLAATQLVPQIGVLIERPLAVFSRFRPTRAGGGFFFGATLGLVFVPCAGPVLAAVTSAAATERFGLRVIALMVAYSLGVALPMLAIAYGGRGAAARLRRHAAVVRTVSGAAIAVVAIGLVLHLDDDFARWVPSWATTIQNKVEDNRTAQKQLAKVNGSGRALTAVRPTVAGSLPDYGVAPPIHADGAWINSAPLALAHLRGKVVLIDFWTYSCINCLRTLPHLEAWWSTYHKDGLVIIGVHTPEFAFEHVTSNVRAAVRRLGIDYPVVQDNRYKTWDNYANEYWPAEYLIDRSGHVRHTHFGESSYGETEQLIRRLLGARGPLARHLADTTPIEALTPESYLGYTRLDRYVGSNLTPDAPAIYHYPAGRLPTDDLAYAGRWTVGSEWIDAGRGARLELHFHAENVYIVLGGRGTVHALVDGKPTRTIHVYSYRLYTVRASHTPADAVLELRFTPGVQAYSFTFG